MMRNPFNEMIILAEDKKPKRNTGIASVLGLMKDLLDFQDKVRACAEAQVSPKAQQVVGRFNDQLVEMYEGLSGIAQSAIYEMKEEAAEESLEEDVVEKVEKTDRADRVDSSLRSPIAPKM